MFAKIHLPTMQVVSDPMYLPFSLRGMSIDALADLYSSMGPSCPPEFASYGFWRVVDERPAETKTSVPVPSGWQLDREAKTVKMHYAMTARPLSDYDSRLLTRLEFRRLFTLEERLLIDNFLTSEKLSIEQKRMLRTVENDFAAMSQVSLVDPDVMAGLDYYTEVGLLTRKRAKEILSFKKR